MQYLINGFISGSVIALLAIALQVVYLPTRVLFVALAGVYSFAPFVASAVLQADGGWVVAIAAAVLFSSGVSMLCELVNHAPLARRGASELAQFVTSLGIYMVLIQLTAMIWGGETRTLRRGLEGITTLGGLVITQSQWTTLVVSAILITGFVSFLLYSDIGLQLRALADNPTQLALFGYNLNYLRLLVFSTAGGLAAAGSILNAYDVGFDPFLGLQAILLALVAVIIGGRSSFAGPVIASLLLGILRAGVVWNFSARWQDAITYALLALFLLFRPQGLISQQSRIEASA